MDPRPAQGISSEAKAAFAGLLARLEAEERVDFELEFGRAGALEPQLRTLHERWLRMQGTFAELEADSEALDSTERELLARHGGNTLAAYPELRALAEQPFEERYEARGALGRGGMGVVERVFDRVLEREVAVKRLRRTHASALRRFLAEARLVAALDHPGIVPVHDAGIDARGRPWFTMPLVSGTSLAVVLALARDRQGGWSRERVLGVLLKTCEIVAYAHARGIVHRDLKPANVMLGAFGEVLVVDWGLAFFATRGAGAGDPAADALDARAGKSEHKTRHGTLVGTPAYMPPEQAAGERSLVGPQSDVYAVGAILYHLLAARAPYAEVGPSNDSVALAVRSGPPVPLDLVAPRAPTELVAICERAMARDAAQRYTDMAALAADLRAFLEGRVVHAYARGSLAELRKWIGRNRALAGALGVIVLLGALAFGLALHNARARHDELVRLADARRLADLDARSAQLEPATPARFPALESWLEEARALAARLALHRRDLELLRLRANGKNADGSPHFAVEEDLWRFGALTALVGALEKFSGPEGELARTQALLDRAHLVEQESLVAHADDWYTARAAIASPLGPYRGLHLEPQFGLVPLAPEPGSGLWLFADVSVGRLPPRGPSGLPLPLSDGALILVLLPAGTAHIGSVRPQAGLDAGDPLARAHEFPPREVELAPFLLSKYELTQAQWTRLSGANPSYLPLAAAAWPMTRSGHPVDTVSWEECHSVLERSGLVLPTEAQWEYAARAGTRSRWWCGQDPASLDGLVNAALNGEADPPRESWSALAGAPNAWGFYDILGNVAEWTLDPYAPDHLGQFREGDGELLGANSSLRVVRGGSFLSRPAELRCAARDEQSPGTRSAWIGVRPARMLAP
ncbi:MAG: SUMF1/EgtB/PvdO family nonheme iron enzyme [Planctomycetes bacterium]|nr:SUMF1/EgtB/PvdO family nonheme iron enzyme [Planctomycetota bacterium]